MSEVRPVQADPPLQQQQFINPKTGNLTDYGHRVLYALWSRSGEFDDDTFRALVLGFTAASQNAEATRRLNELQDFASSMRAEVAGLRGDPRLATAERAEKKADDANFLALTRAPADAMRRIDELERAVAQMSAAVSAMRAMVQLQSVAAAEAGQDSVLRSNFIGQSLSAINHRLTAESVRQDGEIQTIDTELETRARAALSGLSPVNYNATTGLIRLNAMLEAFGATATAANKGYYTTGVDTWASADLTAFGRSVWALADAAAGRTLLGLGSLATLNTISNANWSGADLDIANGGTGSSTASAARAALGVAIGLDVQAFNSNLSALAGLTLAADKLIYSTGVGALATADFTPGAWVSWTPTVTATTPAGSGFTYTITQARYSKTGRTVAVQGQILITSLGSGPSASGNLVMTLPFTSGGLATACGYESGVSGLGVTGRIDSGATTIAFRLSSGAATAVLNSRLWFAFTYESST